MVVAAKRMTERIPAFNNHTWAANRKVQVVIGIWEYRLHGIIIYRQCRS